LGEGIVVDYKAGKNTIYSIDTVRWKDSEEDDHLVYHVWSVGRSKRRKCMYHGSERQMDSRDALIKLKKNIPTSVICSR
jgi:hypothetical protein